MSIDYGTKNIFTSGIITANTGNFTHRLFCSGVPVSSSGHQHSYLDISDWVSAIDDTITTSLVGGNHINLYYNEPQSSLTISAVGLQPAGDYAALSHQHVVDHIIGFSSSAAAAAPVQSVAGKIGNVVLSSSDVGLSNIDNTSDINKPVSIAQALADSAIQNLAAADASVKDAIVREYAVHRNNHTGTQLANTISDFGTAVSGLLPTILNSGDNRLLTSVGTPVGIEAENNLTFNGSFLSINGSGNFSSGLYINYSPVSISGHNHNISDITNLVESLLAKADTSNATFTSGVIAVYNPATGPIFSVGASGLVPIGSTTNTAGTSIGNNGRMVVSCSGGSPLRIKRFGAVGSPSAVGNLVEFYHTGISPVGTIRYDGTSLSYNISSDYRLKENIEPLYNATNILKQIPVYTFNFINDPNKKNVAGFLAHEVQPLVPESVGGIKDFIDENNNPVYQTIDQSKLIPVMLKTIQEMLIRIENLEKN